MRLAKYFVVMSLACLLASCSSSDSSSVPTSESWVEVAKLEPTREMQYRRVFLSGDRVLAGGGGAVILYERDRNGVWQDVTSIEPIGLVDSNSDYGEEMAMFGDTAIVLASKDSEIGLEAGAAYLFEQTDSREWIEVEKILPDPGSTINAVSIDGDRAMLGGADNIAPYSGAIQVYERDLDNEWLRVASITPSDIGGDQSLSLSADGISLSGDRALVGSHGDHENGYDSGAVYLFERDSYGVWVEQAKLVASDAKENDHFGFSVSLYDDYAFIGQYNPFNPVETPSSVYVFERSATGDWLEVAKLESPELSDRDTDVQIEYDNDGQITNVIDNNDDYDGFGLVVSLFAERALVAAAFGGVDSTGAVYEYQRSDSGEWLLVDELSNDLAFEFFGWSISLFGDRAAVAARNPDNSGYGLVYVYEKRAD